MSSARAIDVHAHILLTDVMGTCGALGPEMGVSADGTSYFRSGQYILENVKFLDSPFSDVSMRLERMDELGFSGQLLSPNPLTYFYDAPLADALSFNRRHNDALGEIVSSSSRFRGMAALPMQDAEAAAAELRRAVEELGLSGSYVGSNIAGRVLSDPVFDDLWSEHERLGVPVVVHPAPGSTEGRGLPDQQPWDLEILYGFLVDEGIAVAHLVLGGVLDRHPGLHAHIPHGGGFAPYQKGRLETGVEKRPWGRDLLSRPFSEVWRQLSFDSTVHRSDALAYLVSTEGADRVMMGSNFAGWDQEVRSVAMVTELGLDEAATDQVLFRNAEELFGFATDPTGPA